MQSNVFSTLYFVICFQCMGATTMSQCAEEKKLNKIKTRTSKMVYSWKFVASGKQCVILLELKYTIHYILPVWKLLVGYLS